MAAPLGNQFWLMRSSHGRKPIFPDPETLWDACCQYFQWVEDNPLWESKIASDKGEPKILILPKMRAMTIGGLCLFLDIELNTWKEYLARQDFTNVVTRAEEVIRHQKFTGASADLLNANIIARDLGLADKTELTGKDGGPIEYTNTERAARIAALLDRGRESRARQSTEG